MIALKVTVPVACFRKGFIREFWETEDLPPPSTCYGFLLSLVGERDRRRHIGARVCPALLARSGPAGTPLWPERSAVLRTLWRVKDRKALPGTGSNLRPDYQELLTNTELVIWLDSAEEQFEGPSLAERVAIALDQPSRIERFGGLSLGESTHLVDEVRRLRPTDFGPARAFLLAERGRLSLPVWVDHVGSAGTRFVSGNLELMTEIIPPSPEWMPKIEPPESTPLNRGS
ncbi:MAG: type I-MYXAN CRISPR-associated protein Cas5/Cmx5/DevS [Isosphaeraceae bacterium]|nr:type I-MYXAN CRISPR-associated protein Cas5/Cmx5/DevS [Isosphaeraceae bacterium]